MTADESLKAGDLEGTLAKLKETVRDNPSDPKHRIFLFQLLSVLGQWKSALNQLNVLADLDDESLLMVQAYRAAIQGEVFRSEVYEGKRSPLILGKPSAWIALLIEALRVEAEGQSARALELRQEAFEAAPETPGKINGEAFEWLADSDGRLGPVLEAMVEGKLFWIPMDRITSITFEEPKDLRDIVWAPANFRWSNGGEAVGFIPTRYPGTESSADDQLRLARKTEWSEIAPGCFVGGGQRTFTTDTGEYALLDAREVTLESAEGTAIETNDG